jgi:hypothetical protein
MTVPHSSLTIPAIPVQLKPMIENIEPTFPADAVDEGIEVVSLEENSSATSIANQKVFVPAGGSQVGMATIGLMDTIYQPQGGEQLEGAVNGHQSHPRVAKACLVKNIHGGESALS